MKLQALIATSAVAALLALTGCGGDPSSGGGTKNVLTDAKNGTLTVGVGFDRPGLSQKGTDGQLRGFDIDVVTYIAGKLGVPADKIVWQEAPIPQRETLITTGQVDFVIGVYSITAARKEKISFAGPYLTAGQSLLVRKDEKTITGPTTLNGKKLCASAGSTSAQRVKKDYAASVQLQEYDTNSACVQALRNGAIDAITADNMILAGYATSNPGEFRLVGDPFSNEKYGIGLNKDDKQGRDKINDALEAMVADGSWAKAIEKNLGSSEYFPKVDAPKVERY